MKDWILQYAEMSSEESDEDEEPEQFDPVNMLTMNKNYLLGSRKVGFLLYTTTFS